MPLCDIVPRIKTQKRFRSCELPFPALSRPTPTKAIRRPLRLGKLQLSLPAQPVEVTKPARTVASVGREAQGVHPPLVQQGVAEVSGEEDPGGPAEMP